MADLSDDLDEIYKLIESAGSGFKELPEDVRRTPTAQSVENMMGLASRGVRGARERAEKLERELRSAQKALDESGRRR